MRILNLYSGIGGNRLLWGDEHRVTAVESDEVIASIYKDYFPKDEVIIGDAKEYLLQHFQEFDFIWASPPCPTHSRIRNLWSGDGKSKDIGKVSGSSFKFPDMDLYAIIIFLKHFFKGDWVVENVISYYNPLIKPQLLGRHYFWSNKVLQDFKKQNECIIMNQTLNKHALFFDLSTYDLPFKFKRTLLNNCVNPPLGKAVLDSFTKTKQLKLGGGGS